jgi:hypothetical protein
MPNKLKISDLNVISGLSDNDWLLITTEDSVSKRIKVSDFLLEFGTMIDQNNDQMAGGVDLKYDKSGGSISGDVSILEKLYVDDSLYVDKDTVLNKLIVNDNGDAVIVDGNIKADRLEIESYINAESVNISSLLEVTDIEVDKIVVDDEGTIITPEIISDVVKFNLTTDETTDEVDLNEAIQKIYGVIVQEVIDRESDDNTLDNKIDSEITNRIDEDAALGTRITNIVNGTTTLSGVTAEEEARIAEDKALDNKIDAEEKARIGAIEDNIGLIVNETGSRIDEDTALGTRITNIVNGTTTLSGVTTEENMRIDKDTALGTRITNIVNGTTTLSGVTTEENMRIDEDKSLGTRITNIVNGTTTLSGVTTEEKYRKDEDKALDDKIDAEEEARINEDAALDTRITNIVNGTTALSDLTVNGNTTLGDSDDDTVTIKGSIWTKHNDDSNERSYFVHSEKLTNLNIYGHNSVYLPYPTNRQIIKITGWSKYSNGKYFTYWNDSHNMYWTRYSDGKLYLNFDSGDDFTFPNGIDYEFTVTYYKI